MINILKNMLLTILILLVFVCANADNNKEEELEWLKLFVGQSGLVMHHQYYLRGTLKKGVKKEVAANELIKYLQMTKTQNGVGKTDDSTFRKRDLCALLLSDLSDLPLIIYGYDDTATRDKKIDDLLKKITERGVRIKKTREYTRYYIKGAFEWNTQWYINGEPAHLGYGQYFEDVTDFVKKEENKAKIYAQPISKEADVICETSLVSYDANSMHEKKIGGIEKREKKLDELRKEFNFISNNNVQYSWQFTDDINELSENDKKNIRCNRTAYFII